MHTTRRTVTAILGAALLLTGCGDTENGDNDDQATETEAVTATENPEARQVEVAAQVIEYYEREADLRAEDGMLGEDAREIATYSWIDKRNENMDRLLGGGRTLEIVETTTTDHQVLSFNDTGSGPDAWTIIINACVDSRWDYREEDGTVIDDPDDLHRGAEQVTARYDGPNDVWKLTAFENGDAEACGYESQTNGADDSASTTEEP